jgi:hypothetical protein
VSSGRRSAQITISIIGTTVTSRLIASSAHPSAANADTRISTNATPATTRTRRFQL